MAMVCPLSVGTGNAFCFGESPGFRRNTGRGAFARNSQRHCATRPFFVAYCAGGSAVTHSLTALVPIKGKSERVPGKNLRDFCGKPLLCRILETLQQSRCISRIVVNTDSDAIASLAVQWGKVRIHARPDHLCGGHVPMNHILCHDLEMLGEGHYLQTHVTNPLLRMETIAGAVTLYFRKLPEHDSLFSVIELHSRFWRADGSPLNHDPSILRNTQDMEPLYEENSCLYLFSKTSFQAAGNNRIGRRPSLFPMLRCESLDIDTEDDFRLAEIAWKTCMQRTRGEKAASCQ
jgi:CMP-N-acetylneuraminic acid synthetase